MEEDRLSDLPKIILHRILSRLPEKDAARTSVLSKDWAQTWSTFPILSFSDRKFGGRWVYDWRDSMKRKEFLDNVERTLLRFRNQGLAIEQFKLRMNSFDLYDCSKNVDLYLKLAIESGVRVLELDTHHRYCPQYYILPTGIFEAKSLTKLVLKGRIKVDLSFMNHSMKFFSLQVLRLVDVFLGDDLTFKHLISCCPLIEYIILSWNKRGGDKERLHILDLCGLTKLKGVYVHEIKEVYVDSMCLENLHCLTTWCPVKEIDFSKCKNLKELFIDYLLSTIITNEWFLDLFANLPFLERLKLRNCKMSERIDISSVQLKVLNLLDCIRLKEVNIDAPNLLLCEYDCQRVPKSISFLRCSSQMKVNIRLKVYTLDIHNFIGIHPKLQA